MASTSGPRESRTTAARRRRSRFAWLALLLSVSALPGCEEEWWLEADGSGRLQMVYSAADIQKINDLLAKGTDEHQPKSVSLELLAEDWRKKGLQVDAREETLGSETRMLVDVEFDSLEQLSNLDDKGQISAPEVTLTPQADGTVEFRYDTSRKINALETLTVHLPGAITVHNAAEVSLDRRTATWRQVTMGDTSSMIPTARIKPAANARVWPYAVGTGAVVLAFSVVALQRRRRSTAAPPPGVALETSAHRVFISHSSKDAEQAAELCALIESDGIRCWIAPRDVRPGQEYAAEIMRAIHSCPVMLVLLTRHANESRHVRSEVERAASSNTRILGVRLTKIPPSQGLELFLGPSHWLDLHGLRGNRRTSAVLAAVRPLAQDAPLDSPVA